MCFEHLGRQPLLLALEVHVVGMIERQEMEVTVRHLEADDREADLTAAKALLNAARDALRHREEVCSELRPEVDPVVHLADRNDQRVAGSDRRDGHEGDAVLVAMHETSRNLAADDLGEQARHGFSSHAIVALACGAATRR